MGMNTACRWGRCAAWAGLCLCLAACVGGQRQIRISSEPPGAAVYNGHGVQAGVTPVVVEPDEAFPPRWVGTSYMVKDTLILEKTGCRRHQQAVNDAVLREDIHVQLECTAPGDGAAKPALTGDAATRLRRLQELRQEGLISEAEYRQLRRRILEEL